MTDQRARLDDDSLRRVISRAAPTLWAFVVVAIAVRLYNNALVGTGLDIRPLIHAAENALAGNPVYADEKFQYPPSAILFGLPLTLMSEPMAIALIGLMLAICLVATTIGSFRLWGRPASDPLVPATTLLFVVGPAIWQGVRMTNVVGLIALLMLISLGLSLRQRPVAAGLVLGVSLALKPMLVPLLLLLWWRGERKAAATALAVPALATLLVMLWLPETASFFTDTAVTLSTGQSEAARVFNASLPSQALVLGAPAWLAQVLRLAALIVGIGVSWRIFKRRQSDVDQVVLTSGALMLTAFLAIFAEDHYLTLLIPLLVAAVVGSATFMWRPLALLGAMVMLVPLPLPPFGGSFADESANVSGWYLRLGATSCVAFLAIFGSLGWFAYRNSVTDDD